MATPSAAAATANQAASDTAGQPGANSKATAVDDGLASILAGPAKANEDHEDPEDAEDQPDPEDAADDTDAEDPDAAASDDAASDPAEGDDAAAGDDAEAADDADAGEEPEEEDAAGDDTAADGKKTLDGKLDENLKRARAKLTPEQQTVFDSAVKMVRPQLAALQGQLAAINPELETLRQTNEVLRQGPVATIEGGNPLAGIKTEAELATHLAQTRAARRWAQKKENKDGGIIKVSDGKGGFVEQEISADRVADILIETEETLDVHGPAQEKFLRERREWDHRLTAELPAALKKDTPIGIQVEATLRRYPWLNEVAEGRVMAADMVIGNALRMQSRAARGKAAPGKNGQPGAPGGKTNKPSPGNPPPAPGGQRPPRIAGKTKVGQERVKRFESTGQDEGNGVLAAILTG